MAQSRLIHLEYYDEKAKVRLAGYADTIIYERTKDGKNVITAIRFGGYPELVRGLSDAMYGGATVEATIQGQTQLMRCKPKGYDRQLAHEGVYATVTMMVKDDAQFADEANDDDEPEIPADGEEKEKKPRTCYIFIPAGDKDRLYEELDRKTAAPLIPAYRDYIIDTLIARGFLRKMEVLSLTEKLDAWVLDLSPEDKNVVQALEDGLKSGAIWIPTGLPGGTDGFETVNGVTDYLNTFGVTVAERIRSQFQPLFDPASKPLSDEVLAINEFIEEHAGYSLYDPQLAVAEAVKRQLMIHKCAIIKAECGSGKTKIGSTALGALHGLWARQHQSNTSEKSFGIVMCPSHITKKWVREIAETLPNTYGMVVRSITDLNRLATVLLALEHGEPLDEVVYCEVMFDEYTSGEVPEHRDFILDCAIPFLERNGVKVITLRSPMTYLRSFYRVLGKGPNAGKLNAWPLCGKCCIQRDCKLPPIREYKRGLETDCVQYIGIAADEDARLARLDGTVKVPLLAKYGKTEQDATELCKRAGLLSPVYRFAKRNGCFFCPNASMSELRHLYVCHPDLWSKLLDCQKAPNKATELFNRNYRIDELDERFRTEKAQLSLFNEQVWRAA